VIYVIRIARAALAYELNTPMFGEEQTKRLYAGLRTELSGVFEHQGMDVVKGVG